MGGSFLLINRYNVFIMVLLNVMYTLKSGCKEEFINLLRKENIIEDTRQESSNLKFEFFYPVEDNHDVLLVEMWQDDDSYKKHLQTPHYAKMQEIQKQYIRDISIEKFSK